MNRIRLDDLTSDELDALHAEVDRLTAELADYDQRNEQLEAAAEQHARNTLTVASERDSYRKAWKYEQQRRAHAEAALARVRKACASVQAADQGHNPAINWVAMRVLEAIDARLVNGAEPASASPCAGFPDQCPNPQPVPALSPYHGGGIRCGCTTPKES